MTENHPSQVQEETESISTLALLLTSVGLIVFLLIVIIASVYGVRGFVTQNRIQKENSAGGQEVRRLKAEDQKILSEYKRLDSTTVQIPIDRAMDLVVEEQSAARVREQVQPKPRKRVKKKIVKKPAEVKTE